MNTEWTLVLLWVFISGFTGFILMGIDKARAAAGDWRIPERIFFSLAILGGAFGIVVGSSFFHHKSSKATFMAVVLVEAVLWVGILVELGRLLGSPFS